MKKKKIIIITNNTVWGGNGKFKNKKYIGTFECWELGILERDYWWIKKYLISFGFFFFPFSF
jgi:hypothetical protein